MIKDPDEVLDYAVDWTKWLANEDDAAASAVWIVPTGLTKVAESRTAGLCTVRLSGGTLGADYAVVSRLTTTGGQVADKTMWVKVRSR